MLLNLDSLPKRQWLAMLLLLLAGLLVYANSLHVPFMLDDFIWIHQNEAIRSLNNFFINSVGYEFSPARFIASLTFALNYYFGELSVYGYHVVNLAIHLLSTLLVYTLARLTFETPYFRDEKYGNDKELSSSSSAFQSPHYLIPLFAALVFEVHPVQTEAVTYVVQRMTSLTTLFYLLSLVLYIQARLSMEWPKRRKRSSAPSPFSLRVSAYYIGSVLAAVLAMKTKEIAFTLPLATVMYEVFFFEGSWGRRIIYLLPILATLPIVPMSAISFNDIALKPTGQSASATLLAGMGEQLRAQTDMSRLDYLFTEFRVIVTYLRLLVFPVGQNLDYDYPIYHTFFTPPVYLSFFVLLCFVFLAGWLFRKTSKIKYKNGKMEAGTPLLRLISFGIFWFFLSLSVESSLIPIADVIFEHRLYLPSVGAAIAFSTVFFLVKDKAPKAVANLFILVGSIIVLGLSVATYQRNIIWQSEVGLWEDVVSKSPQKARALSNLGRGLIEADRPWEAISVLSRALAKAPDDPVVNFNLGRAYIRIGQSRTAIPLLWKVIAYKPDYNLAYIVLSAALIMDKKYSAAVTLLEQNLSHLSELPEARFNLGVAYFYSNNPQAARQQLEILSRLDSERASKLAALLR